MPSTKDAAGSLAAKMVQVLQAQRNRGSADYPLTLQRLAELTEATAPTKMILAAIHPQRKAFSQHAVVARQELAAPAALLQDVPLLAASPLLLEFLLAKARTPANHAASAAELKRKVTAKLQRPFLEALERHITGQTLPPTVGWVLIKRARKLFLLADLHTGRTCPSPQPLSPEGRGASEFLPSPLGGEGLGVSELLPSPLGGEGLGVRGTAAPPADGTRDFALAFQEAFERLDRQAGSPNFVSLVDLRRALPWDRQTFDAELRKLRVTGRYGLSAAEGRHGITPDEQQAGLVEEGALLLFVSRK